MNISISVGSWIIPVVITLLAFGAVGVTAYRERHSTGLMAGLGTAIVMFCAIVAITVTWLVYCGTVLWPKG